MTAPASRGTLPPTSVLLRVLNEPRRIAHASAPMKFASLSAALIRFLTSTQKKQNSSMRSWAGRPRQKAHGTAK